MKSFFLLLALAGAELPALAGAEPGWVKLFNGKDLAGWEQVGRGTWAVEDGVIVGHNDPEKPGNYWLVSKEEYDDFLLRLKFWISPGGNSGVAIRDPSRARGPRTPAHMGYEIQILDRRGARMPTGSIYTIQPAIDGVHRSGEWNEMEIRCQGPHLEVTLNGRKVAETDHTRSARGAIGFQLHDRNTVVKFRDVEIRKLIPESR